MCGIAAIMDLSTQPIKGLHRSLRVMNDLQSHRGPDGHGTWVHPNQHVGFGHRRLSIIDREHGAQPMRDPAGNWVTFNGEIYNYVELRDQLGAENFSTESDTEVILAAYRKWGADCVNYLRGMFAFALWDDASGTLLCARDRFGIKPLYYTVVDDLLVIASEVKALLPFTKSIDTDLEAFKDYLTFQLCLSGKTLFKGIRELLPGHLLRVDSGVLKIARYWEVYYHLDFDHTEQYFTERIRDLMRDSVRMHLRSDVPVGAYVSGGFDSSVIASLAVEEMPKDLVGFTGKFSGDPRYDESRYAQALAQSRAFRLEQIDISWHDFVDQIRNVIYHLDYPVAGPGSFPQYMVSKFASQSHKVVLGGQGGDEIFGGYVRYLIAYFEQCIKAAIDDTMHSGNFIVTYESIIQNLKILQQYKPLLKEFWRNGLFEDLDRRYFQLINRAPMLSDEVNWEILGDYEPFETFRSIFHASNVKKESYFDAMTHFDFKTLLPALLHVEDRVSMAHGVESRVPYLDHPLVELSATIPSNIKFKNGSLKHIMKEAMGSLLPRIIMDRTDKMGFPVPLTEWMRGPAREFFVDLFSSQKARQRSLVNNQKVAEKLLEETPFGRTIWGLFSLELWQQEFHDRASAYRRLVEDRE